jgi:IMP dehydrogenase
MKILEEDALSFDDVLLVPQYSEVVSRKAVDLSMNIGGGYILTLPIISSPMDTITEGNMAYSMNYAGGLGIIHRYNSIEEQVAEVEKAAKGFGPIGAAIGATGDFYERAQAVYVAGANLICIDVAHGFTKLVKESVERIRSDFPIHLMVGNVATGDGFEMFHYLGVDSVRVGIGGGSCCSTRKVSGHGIPTLHSIIDVKHRKDFLGSNIGIIADGGIRNTGDMVKAFAAGADAVMIGSMLSGTDETPGEVVDGYKSFRGMASEDAQVEWRGNYSVIEGVSTWVKCKGPVKNILSEIRNGLGSGCSYTGVNRLIDLCENAMFIKQSIHGVKESNPHILETNG